MHRRELLYSAMLVALLSKDALDGGTMECLSENISFAHFRQHLPDAMNVSFLRL